MFSYAGGLLQRALAVLALSSVAYSATALTYDPFPFNFVGTIQRYISKTLPPPMRN
jgi:hypothetical protein